MLFAREVEEVPLDLLGIFLEGDDALIAGMSRKALAPSSKPSPRPTTSP